MCGKEARLFKADVEGSLLNLCERCSRFGKVISPLIEPIKVNKKAPSSAAASKTQEKTEELVLSIIPDYSSIIKKKREALGISQEDFAKKINEKSSLVHKLETGQLEPPFSLARKVEKALHIRLIAQQELKLEALASPKSGHFTIGDFIKIKR
ncbi:multiprotein bridging factor aMBF1 [Candidatus Woesearchaeota archaeon]|nr:multiprotein bridging factor aMBF1 [Candidatus Woesearchaeota archaeon]